MVPWYLLTGEPRANCHANGQCNLNILATGIFTQSSSVSRPRTAKRASKQRNAEDDSFVPRSVKNRKDLRSRYRTRAAVSPSQVLHHNLSFPVFFFLLLLFFLLFCLFIIFLRVSLYLTFFLFSSCSFPVPFNHQVPQPTADQG